MDIKYLTVSLILFISVLLVEAKIEKRDVHRIIIKGGGGSRRPSRSHRHHKDHKHRHHSHHGSFESDERPSRYPEKHGHRHHNHHSDERDHSFEDASKYYGSHENRYDNSHRHKSHYRKPADIFQSIEYDEPKRDVYKESNGWSPLISAETTFGSSFENNNNHHSKRSGSRRNKNKRNPYANIELTTSYPGKAPSYISYFDSSTDFPPLYSFSNDNLAGKPSAPSAVISSYFPTNGKTKKDNSYEVHENHKDDVYPKEKTSFNALASSQIPLLGQSSNKVKEIVAAPKNNSVPVNGSSITNNKINKTTVKNGGSRGRRVKGRS